MDDLVARLRACLDADERVALAAGGDYGAEWEAVNDPAGSSGFEIRLVDDNDTGGILYVDCSREAPATHIARFDPERTLRWVKAAREILRRHEPIRVLDGWACDDSFFSADRGQYEEWPCRDVRALMSAYGDGRTG